MTEEKQPVTAFPNPPIAVRTSGTPVTFKPESGLMHVGPAAVPVAKLPEKLKKA